MTTTSTATRRSFIRTAGAALSGSVAGAVAVAPQPVDAAFAPDDAAARLARLEDLHAIRELNQSYSRHVNARQFDELASLFAHPADVGLDPAVCGMTASGFGEGDAIEIAQDGQTATARLAAVVTLERDIGPDCPVVRMARAQGGGVVTLTQPGVFENVYVRRDGAWKFLRSTFRAT
jgi:hypothetical protein